MSNIQEVVVSFEEGYYCICVKNISIPIHSLAPFGFVKHYRSMIVVL